MSKSMYITRAEMKRRGWSDKMIAEYVKNPCKENIENAYTIKRNVKLWHVQRIEGLEQLPGMREKLDEGIRKLIAAGKQVSYNRRKRFLKKYNIVAPAGMHAVDAFDYENKKAGELVIPH